MAHITKKKGRYYVVAEGPAKDDGRRTQVWSKGYETRAEAEAIMADFAAAAHKMREALTVGGYFTTWLGWKRHTLAPSTWRRYSSMVAVHVIPDFGAMPMDKLTGDHLEVKYREMLDAGLSPTTVKQLHAVIHKAYADAVRRDVVVANPADKAEAPRRRSREMQTWTPEELRRFIAVAFEDEDFAFWLMAATTGMRRGELLGLQWDDLDLDEGVAYVRRSLVWTGQEVSVGPPKTASGQRPVALDAWTVAALREHRSVDEWVFHGPNLNPRWVNRRFEYLIQQAGLPRIRFHDLRHSHASLALHGGLDVKVMAHRLGHANASITQNIYQHATLGMQAAAVDLVGRTLFPDAVPPLPEDPGRAPAAVGHLPVGRHDRSVFGLRPRRGPHPGADSPRGPDGS